VTRRAALLAALVLPLFASGAHAREGDPTPDAPAAAEGRELRILVLGDSYSIGTNAPESARWPLQLARALTAKGIPVAPPRIIAENGWLTENLAKAIAAAELDPPYDLVTLQIGVNDQFERWNDGYPERFSALLARAIELAGAPEHVIVVSIPDWGVTPVGRQFGGERVSHALEFYNRTNQEIAAKEQVAYVDITPGSRRAGSDPSLLTPDGLHPSGKLYAEWVEKLLPAAERALGGRARALR
jgi:lysophospholipase L1-like esterase